jgi:hypothetical protein
MTEIEKAAWALVKKMDEVGNDPAYQGVWTLAQLHFGPYKGPQYVKELDALKAALRREDAQNG